MTASEEDQPAEDNGLDLLPAEDVEALAARNLNAQAKMVGNEIFLVIENYPVPAGYDHEATNLLLRLPRQWPDGSPDMFWTEPHLKLATNGSWPNASGNLMSLDGCVWQRWSRHYKDRWKPGVDRLVNLLAIVSREMKKDVGQ
jgi:hypothetical protein